MGKTSIEWTDASWNPIVGCTEISPGCANCYAARLAATRLRETTQYSGLAILPNGGVQKDAARESGAPRWTGEVRFLLERLEEPLHWRAPRKIFVCDMGDLFHENVPFAQIGKVFDVIARCPQHTFQILTKRAAVMQKFFTLNAREIGPVNHPKMTRTQLTVGTGVTCNWPLPNVWLGVSVENQHFADERIPLLLDTPAAVRWISAEPLLGPVDLAHPWPAPLPACMGPTRSRINWVVCGGESGPNARPMHPDWARQLRDQCASSATPFFFKQWGEWAPPIDGPRGLPKQGRTFQGMNLAGHLMLRYGKKLAGRLLDGREWNEFPVAPVMS